MTIVLDINTRMFAGNDTAWRLFPGSGYRHYDAMRQYNRVFLDLPFLPLVSNAKLEKNANNLRTVSLSIDASPYILRTDDRAAERLSEVLQQERNPTVWSNKRSLTLGWINGIYAEAKIGDIVVVPGPGYRKNEENKYELSPTLIGEIVSDTEIWNERGPANYLAGRYLTRRVRWIEEATEADLSAKAQLSLRTQNALVKINHSELNDVLGAAFKNVITENEVLARFITKNNDPRSYEILQFLSFIQATTAAIKAAREGQVLNGDSIYEIAGQMPRDMEFVLEQDANFHSPGYSTLIARFGDATVAIKNIPLVIACLFALATNPEAQPFDANGEPDIQVINTESASVDPCDANIGVDKDVRDTLRIIGHTRWTQWCEAGSAASTNDGFKSVTGVQNEESD